MLRIKKYFELNSLELVVDLFFYGVGVIFEVMEVFGVIVVNGFFCVKVLFCFFVGEIVKSWCWFLWFFRFCRNLEMSEIKYNCCSRMENLV